MEAKQSEAVSSGGVIANDSISLNTDVDLHVAAAVSIVAVVSAAKRPASRENKMTGTRSDDLQQKFEEWYAHLQHEKFWAWLEESDNATHFKSKETSIFGQRDRARSTAIFCEQCGWSMDVPATGRVAGMGLVQLPRPK